MAKPPYEPEKWNQSDSKAINNCYNYATNKRFAPADKRKYPPPAEPGRASGLTLGLNIGYDILARNELGEGERKLVLFGPAVEIECDGIKNACLADGMKAALDGPRCESDECWLIAYYRKPAEKFGDSGVFWKSADYHFVRQDADNKWSHKPGADEVTRKQYNPEKNDFSGPEIDDPAKANVGTGYQFCGYLCCCEETRVAMLDLPGTGQARQGAVVTMAEGYALTPGIVALLEGTDFVCLLEELTREVGGSWMAGPGEGKLRYRLDVGDGGDFTEFSLLVNDASVTIRDGTARHLSDPGGLVARRFGEWFLAKSEWRRKPC